MPWTSRDTYIVADFSFSALSGARPSSCLKAVGPSPAPPGLALGGGGGGICLLSDCSPAVVEDVDCCEGALIKDARLSFNFFSPWADILVNSATNDWPQNALQNFLSTS
jgi:hypothetical protein